MEPRPLTHRFVPPLAACPDDQVIRDRIVLTDGTESCPIQSMSRQEGDSLFLARIAAPMPSSPNHPVVDSPLPAEIVPQPSQHPARRRIVQVVGCLGLIGALMALLPQALRYEPPFYRDALAMPAATRQLQSERFLATLLDLRNDAANEAVWETRWPEEQLNGWLAEHLEEELGAFLATPTEGAIRQPRIDFERDRAHLAFRGRLLGLETVFEAVLSVARDFDPDPSAAKPKTKSVSPCLVLKIESVSAGLIPLPVGMVADRLTKRGAWPGFLLERDPTSDHPGRLRVTPSAEGRSILAGLGRLEILQGTLRITGGRLADRSAPSSVLGDRSADQPAARR